jgi:phosphatidylinositol glycan class B
MTWEWDKAIRSSAHPLLFAGLYKTLAWVHLDTPAIIVIGPRLLQAVLAAVCDVFVYKLAHQLWSSRVYAGVAYVLHLSFWFSLYCMTRTLSNTMETVLTTVGIHFWLAARRHFRFSTLGFALGVISCFIRPTAIFMWLPMATIHIFTSSTGPLCSIILQFLPTGAILMIMSILCDFLFYGKVVFVQYNFLHFNVFEGVANFYGTHPWHWYFTQGIVVVWLSWTPVVLYTFYGVLHKAKDKFLKGRTKSKRILFAVKKMLTLNHHIWMLFLIVFEVVAHSFLGHKEFRFILPILPLTAVLMAPSVHGLWVSRYKFLKAVCAGMLLSNLVTAGYFCLVHQRGTLDAVGFLRQEFDRSKPSGSVLFLMPCHHSPFYR